MATHLACLTFRIAIYILVEKTLNITNRVAIVYITAINIQCSH